MNKENLPSDFTIVGVSYIAMTEKKDVLAFECNENKPNGKRFFVPAADVLKFTTDLTASIRSQAKNFFARLVKEEAFKKLLADHELLQIEADKAIMEKYMEKKRTFLVRSVEVLEAVLNGASYLEVGKRIGRSSSRVDQTCQTLLRSLRHPGRIEYAILKGDTVPPDEELHGDIKQIRKNKDFWLRQLARYRDEFKIPAIPKDEGSHRKSMTEPNLPSKPSL